MAKKGGGRPSGPKTARTTPGKEGGKEVREGGLRDKG